jgi:hypothetical protein
MASEAQLRIEAYLSKLRQGLRGMKDEDPGEIVEELRSHIADKASASGEMTVEGVKEALAALGDPDWLASQYMTDDVVSRTEVSRSPVRTLDSLFRWASLSVAGFFVLAGSLAGYFFGALFILWALLKPFHPHTAGLWVSRDTTGDLAISLGLGFGSAPAGAKDVLGWWLVPLGLLVGYGLVMLTRRFAAWCACQYRRSRRLPQHG